MAEVTVTAGFHAEEVESIVAHRVRQHVWISLGYNAAIHLSLETIAKLESALIEAKVLCHEAEGERIAADLLKAETEQKWLDEGIDRVAKMVQQ